MFLGYWKPTGNSGGLISGTSRRKTPETPCLPQSPTTKIKVASGRTRAVLSTSHANIRLSFRESVENKPNPGPDPGQRSPTTSANINTGKRQKNEGFLNFLFLKAVCGKDLDDFLEITTGWTQGSLRHTFLFENFILVRGNVCARLLIPGNCAKQEYHIFIK